MADPALDSMASQWTEADDALLVDADAGKFTEAGAEGGLGGRPVPNPKPEDELLPTLEDVGRIWDNFIPNAMNEFEENVLGVPELLGDIIKGSYRYTVGEKGFFSEPSADEKGLGEMFAGFADAFAGGLMEKFKDVATNPVKAIVDQPASTLSAAFSGGNLARSAAGKSTFGQGAVNSLMKKVEGLPKISAMARAGGMLATLPSGRTTEEFVQAFESARKNSSPLTKQPLVMARQKIMSPSEIVRRTNLAWEKIQVDAGHAYTEGVKTLKVKNGESLSHLDVMTQAFKDIKDDFGITFKRADKGGAIRFKVVGKNGQALPTDLSSGERASIERLAGYLHAKTSQGLKTVENFDGMKKAIGRKINWNKMTDTSFSDAIHKRVYDRYRVELGNKVENYDSVANAYDKAQDARFDLRRAMGIGLQEEQQITKLMGLLKENPAKTPAREILRQMSDDMGFSFEEAIAGMASSRVETSGLIGRAFASATASGLLGATAFGVTGGVAALAAIPFIVPRSASAIFSSAGLGVKHFDAFSKKWLDPVWDNVKKLNINPSVIYSYGDAVALLNMSESQRRVFEQERLSKERVGKAIMESAQIPMEVKERFLQTASRDNAK
jgi:hypothetical protein